MTNRLTSRRARLALYPQTAFAAPSTDPLAVAKVDTQGSTLRITARGGSTGAGAIPADAGAPLPDFVGDSASRYESIDLRLHGHPLRGAVNCALLDLIGKQANAPIYQVLGGPTRHKVRVMVRAGSDSDVAAAYARGHRTVVLAAPGIKETGAFADRVKSLRAAHAGLDFVADGAGRMSPGEAGSVATAIEGIKLLWLDEPCRSNPIAPVAKIAAECVTPLGFGGGARAASEFQELLRSDAVDILRPSLDAFGISGIRRIAALAETYYVAVAPRRGTGELASLAALHLAASLPNFFIQEIPPDLPWRVQDGYVNLPEGAGLGRMA